MRNTRRALYERTIVHNGRCCKYRVCGKYKASRQTACDGGRHTVCTYSAGDGNAVRYFGGCGQVQ